MMPSERRVMAIIGEEAARARISPDDLLGPSRRRKFVIARCLAMWRARQETKLSFPRLGRLFNRHHSTIMHATQKMEAQPIGDLLQKVTRYGV